MSDYNPVYVFKRKRSQHNPNQKVRSMHQQDEDKSQWWRYIYKVLHKPSMRTLTNTTMSRWTLLRSEIFSILIQYRHVFTSGIHSILSQRPKTKWNKDSVTVIKINTVTRMSPSDFILKVWTLSISIELKYIYFNFCSEKVIYFFCSNINHKLKNIRNKTQHSFIGDQQSSKSSMLVNFAEAGSG